MLEKVIVAKKQKERIKSYSSRLPKEKSRTIDVDLQLPKPRGINKILLHIQDKIDRKELVRLEKLKEEDEI